MLLDPYIAAIPTHQEATMPARLDFKAIAESVDVETVATRYGLALKRSQNDLRAKCPACQTDDERSLAIYPETNSFRCFAAKLSGDCISLHAHLNGYEGMYKAAKELAELFLTDVPDKGTVSASSRPTPPQKPEGRNQPAPASRHKDVLPDGARKPRLPGEDTDDASARREFDPEVYAQKLVYCEELAELGIPEDAARDVGLGNINRGFNKGLTIAVRWPSGEVACFGSVVDGKLKLPPYSKWLRPKVVRLKTA